VFRIKALRLATLLRISDLRGGGAGASGLCGCAQGRSVVEQRHMQCSKSFRVHENTSSLAAHALYAVPDLGTLSTGQL